MPLINKVLRKLFFKIGLYLSKNKGYFVLKNKYPSCTLSDKVVIEGNPSQIFLGEKTRLEAGAVLSTQYGGKITIGEKCMIGRGAMILTYGGDIQIGDRCGVNPYTILYGHGGLKIGNDVRIAVHCVVIPANHTFSDSDKTISQQPLTKKGIIIGNDVWVAAGVRILDGVRIGNGAVIGAGAVLTKDVPDYSINVGVPARVIGTRKS